MGYFFWSCDVVLAALIVSLVIPEFRTITCWFGSLMNALLRTGYEDWWADALWPVGIIAVIRLLFHRILPPRSDYSGLVGRHHLMIPLLTAAACLIVLNAVYHLLLVGQAEQEPETPRASN